MISIISEACSIPLKVILNFGRAAALIILYPLWVSVRSIPLKNEVKRIQIFRTSFLLRGIFTVEPRNLDPSAISKSALF